MLLTSLPSPVLILGPAHAGKSQLAVQCLNQESHAVVVATATALDKVMAQRLCDLAKARPSSWQTVETQYDIAGSFAKHAGNTQQVLIDSVNQWLAAALVRELSQQSEAQAVDTLLQEVEELGSMFAPAPAPRTVVVSSELGAAPPQANSAERALRRLVGLANQKLAARAASVVLVTAGVPLILKGKN